MLRETHIVSPCSAGVLGSPRVNKHPQQRAPEYGVPVALRMALRRFVQLFGEEADEAGGDSAASRPLDLDRVLDSPLSTYSSYRLTLTLVLARVDRPPYCAYGATRTSLLRDAYRRRRAACPGAPLTSLGRAARTAYRVTPGARGMVARFHRRVRRYLDGAPAQHGHVRVRVRLRRAGWRGRPLR